MSFVDLFFDSLILTLCFVVDYNVTGQHAVQYRRFSGTLFKNQTSVDFATGRKTALRAIIAVTALAVYKE